MKFLLIAVPLLIVGFSACRHRDVNSEVTKAQDTTVSGSCPKNYVWVPGSSTPGIGSVANTKGVAPFCIAKFEMKNPTDPTGLDRGNRKNDAIPESQPQGRPWVFIGRKEAHKACGRITQPGFYFSLVSNGEWQTVLRNIENVAANWSGGAVGSGEVPSGNARGPEMSLAVLDESNPYNGYRKIEPVDKFRARRITVLSTSETIWDLAGNVWEWVNDDLETIGLEFHQRGESLRLDKMSPKHRLILGPSRDIKWEQNLGSFVVGGYSEGMLRGGGYSTPLAESPGLFKAYIGIHPTEAVNDVGFRCVARTVQ